MVAHAQLQVVPQVKRRAAVAIAQAPAARLPVEVELRAGPQLRGAEEAEEPAARLRATAVREATPQR
jgi:hypothetical protein